MTMRDYCNMPTIAKLAQAALRCLLILWLLSLLRHVWQQAIHHRTSCWRSSSTFYLAVAWSPPREEGSWWVTLTQERREAIVWTIDSVLHGEPFQVTISTKLGGTRTVYLTSIVNSETGDFSTRLLKTFVGERVAATGMVSKDGKKLLLKVPNMSQLRKQVRQDAPKKSATP